MGMAKTLREVAQKDQEETHSDVESERRRRRRRNKRRRFIDKTCK